MKVLKSFVTIPKAVPKIGAGTIISILTLILQLILSGISESEALEIASSRHNVPLCTVKKLWKNR